MAIQLHIIGVLQDGYNIVEPSVQPLAFSQGDDGYVILSIINSNQTPTLITGTLILSVRNPYDPSAVLFDSTVDIDDAKTASFYISSTNTNIASFPYEYDLVFIDGYSNVEHLVLPSQFDINTSVYKANQ